MATLKTALKFLDFIMDKIDHKKIYMVLHEDLHEVHVIKDGGGEAPTTIPKRIINLAYIKIDPKVARVLYGEQAKENSVDSSAGSSDSTSEG